MSDGQRISELDPAVPPILGDATIALVQSGDTVEAEIVDIRNPRTQSQSGAYSITTRIERPIIAWTVGASDVDLDLPSSSIMEDGDMIKIVRMDSDTGIGSIVASGADTIDTSINLVSQYDNVSLMIIGTSWIVISLHAIYDSSWVSISDWTDVDISIQHNLGVNLSDILVRFLFSTDGTDGNSYELLGGESHRPVDTNTVSYGYNPRQVSVNEIAFRTSDGGIQYIDSSGTRIILTSTGYYRAIFERIR